VIFEVPKLPTPIIDKKKIYGMNAIALQLNHLSSQLLLKLPPTDSRLRPDMQYWEKQEGDLASKEKERLEENQRQRRKEIKKIFQNNKSVDLSDERTYHNPLWFTKTKTQDEKGNTLYNYFPNGKYWEQREFGEWKDSAKIFENDC